MKLFTRLSLFIVLMALILISIVGFLSYYNARRIIEQEIIGHLEAINLLKSSGINQYIHSALDDITVIARSPQFKELTAILAASPDQDARTEAYTNIQNNYLDIAVQERGNIFEMFVMDAGEGRILLATDRLQEGKYGENQPYFIEGKTSAYIQPIYYSTSRERATLTISTPVTDDQGNLVAVLAAHLDLEPLSEIIVRTSGCLKRTEDTYLVDKFNFFITNPLFGDDYAFRNVVHTQGVEAALAGKDGAALYYDYRGVPVVGAYSWLPEYETALITEIDQAEAFAPPRTLALRVAVFGSAAALLAALLAWYIANSIAIPIRHLGERVEEFRRGNFDHQKVVTGIDEIIRLDRAFNHMAKDVHDYTTQLEASNKELSSFAYSVAHNLRAPLRAMSSFSEILLAKHGRQLDEQGKHYLERIQAASSNLGQLIDGLLTLTRVTRSEMTYQRFDISKVAAEIMADLQITEPERRVEIEIAAGLTARGDISLLRSVLENLLDNAWKFSSKEKQAEIEVGQTIVDGEDVFFVRDNGVGFNMAYTDKLFGAFQRLHGAEEFPGTGIGLATVQRIINRHGGRTWAESEVGKGATFYFILPQ